MRGLHGVWWWCGLLVLVRHRSSALAPPDCAGVDPVDVTGPGTAAPELVWSRYADLAQWSQWSPQVHGVESSASRIACGVTGSVVGPLGLRVAFVIDEVDESRRSWAWRVHFGPVHLRLTHSVETQEVGASTALVIDGPAAYVVGYAPLARLALTRLVRP